MREKELRGYPLDSEEHAVLMCSASWRSPVLTLRLALPFSAAEPAGDLPARRRAGLGRALVALRHGNGTGRHTLPRFPGHPPPPQSYERKHRSEGVSEECDPVARRLAQGTVGFGQGTRPGAGSVPSAQGAACGRQPINDSLTIDASNPLPPSESIKTLKGTRPFPQEGPWQGGGQGRTRGLKRGPPGVEPQSDQVFTAENPEATVWGWERTLRSSPSAGGPSGLSQARPPPAALVSHRPLRAPARD